MPRVLVNEEYKKQMKTDDLISDDDVVKVLSKKFNVSQIAMTYRLSNLDLIHHY